MTFESSQKLTAITLRQTRNVDGDPLYTTLPVVDLNAPATRAPLVFPHIAAGGSFSTQIILINASSQSVRGQIGLFDEKGVPVSLTLSGANVSLFSYDIPAHGTYRAELTRSGDLQSGYAVVTPDPGYDAPSGSGVFRFTRGTNLITEAGIGATLPTTAARIFVDNAGSSTGVAVVNLDNQPSTLTFRLLDHNGEELEDPVTRTLDPNAHLARFVQELFPDVTDPFTGLLEVSSTRPMAPITLRITYNQRNDLVLTTLPVVDLTRPSSASVLIFPHIALGGGFSTRLIAINADTGKPVSGSVSFFDDGGSPMPVLFGTQSSSPYQITEGGGKQFFPGNPAQAARIVMVDPSTNGTVREVAITEGNTVRPKVVVMDSTGTARDDFSLSYKSLDTDVATIDAFGKITAKKRGFSTLTISSLGQLAPATINVTGVDSVGQSGYGVTGVVQDAADRLYLAATPQHTILLAPSVIQTPDLYAGIKNMPGRTDATRVTSSFRNPAFLS